MASKDEPPAVGVSIVSAQPNQHTSQYAVAWQITNSGLQAIELEESWLPHGKFRGARQAFEPHLILPAGATGLHQRMVDVIVMPGGVVENAFLILQARCQGELWRIFVRMRVEAPADRNARPIVEAITASPVRA